jgi:shikimate kinase
MLIVITGPVGGGKSTVALAVADRLRQTGRTAAVIDLDLVYCMARQVDGYGELDMWAAARHGAAALADAFFADGMCAVIVEGEFFSHDELDALRGRLATAARCRFVTLVVSYETALRHVAGDPSRGMSRDPEFLRRLHAQFEKALPFLEEASLLIQADRPTPSELAETICDATLTESRAP